MLLAVIALIALVFPAVSLAEVKTFLWSNPTANTDGSLFDPAVDQAEVRIFCNGVLTVTANNGSESVTHDFAPGTYDCVARVVATNGEISGDSNPVNFTVAEPVPNPVTGFTVQ